MGFKAPTNIFRLQFDDPEYEGLEVRAKSVPLGGFLSMMALMDVDTRNIQAGDKAKLAELFDRFSKALIEWNVEDDDGAPVPATVEGLHSLDIPFAMLIIRAWVAALSQVPDFLPQRSSDGGPSLELSIPMTANSSPSPPS